MKPEKKIRRDPGAGVPVESIARIRELSASYRALMTELEGKVAKSTGKKGLSQSDRKAVKEILEDEDFVGKCVDEANAAIREQGDGKGIVLVDLENAERLQLTLMLNVNDFEELFFRRVLFEFAKGIDQGEEAQRSVIRQLEGEGSIEVGESDAQFHLAGGKVWFDEDQINFGDFQQAYAPRRANFDPGTLTARLCKGKGKNKKAKATAHLLVKGPWKTDDGVCVELAKVFRSEQLWFSGWS
jgi:hypothetical protein